MKHMNFKLFRQLTLERLNWYFHLLQEYTASSNKIRILGKTILFPTTALFVETKDHYLIELFGLSDKFQNLNEKTHKENSTINYLSQSKLIDGEKERFILEGGINGGISGIFIRRDLDYAILKTRFPFAKKLWEETAQLVLVGGDGHYFDFKDTFKHCYLNNCILGNRFGNIHRIKNILFMAIVGKSQDKDCYQDWIDNFLTTSLLHRTQSLIDENFEETLDGLNSLFGIQLINTNHEKLLHLIRQFSSFFLIPGISETSLGDFLDKNPDFTKAAFSCKSFISQIQLPWIEGNPDPTEKKIIPDLMLEREDGYFDICDLKLPKVDRANITKDSRRRRRFIDYVNEGVSQLANYEEYFSFQANAEFAKSKYGVKVSNPKLFLVVGSYENVNKEEVKEAARSLRDNFYIIDYDTVNSLAFYNSA